MGRLRADVVVDEAPAGTVAERWWSYLRDVGSFRLGGLPAGGAVALRNEWIRLDGSDKPIPERIEAWTRFCKGLGVPDWCVRAQVQLGRASARQRADDPQAADERRRRLSAPGYFQPTKGRFDE